MFYWSATLAALLMYANWLTPPSVDLSPAIGNGIPTVAGRLSPTVSAHTRAVLIGVSPDIADRVREALYGLSWDMGELVLVDLGNLRRPSVEFSIPLLRELHGSGIVPILLGADAAFVRAQYLAFGELNRQVGICSIDQWIGLSTNPAPPTDRPLDAAVHRRGAPAFHLCHIGAQRHLVDPELAALFELRHFDSFPLGLARAELTELEPAIRDCDVMQLHIGGLLHAEAPAQEGYHGSGFSLQEASQLCFYGGNSDRMASFGLYGLTDGDRNDAAQRLTVAAYAQLAWYFLHGMSLRCNDFPVASSGMTEYMVDTQLRERVTFWRSPRSGRWWVQVPIDAPAGSPRNRLVACSERDYQRTREAGRLPDRILSAFVRY